MSHGKENKTLEWVCTSAALISGFHSTGCRLIPGHKTFATAPKWNNIMVGKKVMNCTSSHVICDIIFQCLPVESNYILLGTLCRTNLSMLTPVGISTESQIILYTWRPTTTRTAVADYKCELWEFCLLITGQGQPKKTQKHNRCVLRFRSKQAEAGSSQFAAEGRHITDKPCFWKTVK